MNNRDTATMYYAHAIAGPNILARSPLPEKSGRMTLTTLRPNPCYIVAHYNEGAV